jgi:hypothetical protein
MYLIARFFVDIDVVNPIEFYMNFDQNLISKLRQLYDGICYGGRLILRVVGIADVGECVINQPTSATLGVLSVAFDAVVVDYKPGDLITCVGVRASRDGITMVRAKHSDIMLDQPRGSRELELLQPESAVVVRLQNTDANPGYRTIAARGAIFSPDRATYYYPIATAGDSVSDGAEDMLTRAIYIPLSAIMRAFDGELAKVGGGDADFPDDMPRVNVREALRDAMDVWAHLEVNEKLKSVIVPSMFNALTAGASVAPVHAECTRVNLVDCAAKPGATCLVIPGDVPPLDGKVDIAMLSTDKLPADWKCAAIAQPADVVIARCMEHQIDLISAAVALAREFSNPACMSATMGLMKLFDAQRKSKP